MTETLNDPRPLSPLDLPEIYLPWKADYGRHGVIHGYGFDDLIESVAYDLQEGFEVEYTIDARTYDHHIDPREDTSQAYCSRMRVPDAYGQMFFRIEEFNTGETIEEGLSNSDAVFLVEVCCYLKDHFTIMFGPHDPTP